MTLVSVGNSEGIVGRCDAKCYNAKHPNCDCICGGKNHGAGLQQALANTSEQVESWVKRYAQEKGLTDYQVITSSNQLPLL